MIDKKTIIRYFLSFIYVMLLSIIYFQDIFYAQDIWQDKDWLKINKVFRVGDIIFTKVNLPTNIKMKIVLQNKGKSIVSIAPDKNITSFLPNVNSNKNKNSTKNSSVNYKSAYDFILPLRITGKENKTGNLLVEGQRTSAFNQSQQFIRIKGIVRPQDIKANNMIEAYKIANLEFIIGITNRQANTIKQLQDSKIPEIDQQRLLLQYINRILSDILR